MRPPLPMLLLFLGFYFEQKVSMAFYGWALTKKTMGQEMHIYNKKLKLDPNIHAFFFSFFLFLFLFFIIIFSFHHFFPFFSHFSVFLFFFFFFLFFFFLGTFSILHFFGPLSYCLLHVKKLVTKIKYIMRQKNDH